MSYLRNFLAEQISRRRQDNNFRQLTIANGLDFTSNDYLGFARSTELSDKIKRRLESLPVSNGSTGSRLLSGNSKYGEEVEQRLCKVFNSESFTIFNSGYTANLAVLSSIPGKGDTILYDEAVHASIKDGMRLSFAGRFAFRHNDLEDLVAKLDRTKGHVYVVVESVYSMDGDVAPLKDLDKLSRQFNFTLIVDEAHATGIFGDKGSGLASALDVAHSTAIRIFTFGKAMGCHGAGVAGPVELKDFLVNFARPFIYTTALPQHSLAAIDCAFESVTERLQYALQQKISIYHASMGLHGIFATPIQTMILPGNDYVRTVADQLRSSGFDVRPILSPTVVRGTERIRICLHTFNSDEEIVALCRELNKFRT